MMLLGWFGREREKKEAICGRLIIVLLAGDQGVDRESPSLQRSKPCFLLSGVVISKVAGRSIQASFGPYILQVRPFLGHVQELISCVSFKQATMLLTSLAKA